MSYVDEIPIGTIIIYGGIKAPPGFFLCDGSKYKIGDFNRLFKEIVLTYDDQSFNGDLNDQTYINSISGDYFCVPDLRGRLPIGSGIGKEYTNGKRNIFNSLNGKDLPAFNIGNYGGENKHTLTANEVADHIHYFFNWSFSEHWGNVRINALGEAFPAASGDNDGVDYDNWPYATERWTNVTLLQGATHRPDLENKSLQARNQPHNNMQPYCVVNYIIRAY